MWGTIPIHAGPTQDQAEAQGMPDPKLCFGSVLRCSMESAAAPLLPSALHSAHRVTVALPVASSPASLRASLQARCISSVSHASDHRRAWSCSAQIQLGPVQCGPVRSNPVQSSPVLLGSAGRLSLGLLAVHLEVLVE